MKKLNLFILLTICTITLFASVGSFDTLHSPTGLFTINGDVLWQAVTDSGTSWQWLDKDGGTPIVEIDAVSELVCIGCTNPSRAKLVVVGSVGTDNGAYGFLNSAGEIGTASGSVLTTIFADNRIVGGEFDAVSDERVKEYIHSYDGALEVVSSLNVVGYNKLSKSGGSAGELGLIGQELVKVLPLAVRISPGDVPDGKGGWKEVDDFHQINYQTVFILAVRAIQEQQEQIDKLKGRLEDLERQ